MNIVPTSGDSRSGFAKLTYLVESAQAMVQHVFQCWLPRDDGSGVELLKTKR